MRKVTVAKTMENLRALFKYNEKGEPDIYSYGAFHMGLTDEEINNYLRVRTNQFDIRTVRKFYDTVTGADTCAVWSDYVTVNGKKVAAEVVLHYRHDVKRYADQCLEGKPTYFD